MKQRGNNWCYLSPDRDINLRGPLEPGRLERICSNRDDEYSGRGKLDRFNFRVNLRKIEISLSLSLSPFEVRGGRCTRLNKEIMNAFDWEWAESKERKKGRRKYFWTDLYSHVAMRTIDATQHSDRSHRAGRPIAILRSNACYPRG